jgi:hypothetical protein
VAWRCGAAAESVRAALTALTPVQSPSSIDLYPRQPPSHRQLALLRQLIAGSFRSDRKFFVEGIDAGSPT